MPAFDLAVGLRVIGRGSDVGHAGDADELLEVLGDELRAVVADDAWPGFRELFPARCRMISTSVSSIFSRISQWTMKRL